MKLKREAKKLSNYNILIILYIIMCFINITYINCRFIWCTKCRHGGHLEHIKEWFLELMVCPIPDCICICVENNHLIC